MAEPGKLLFVTPKSERKLRQLVGAPNTTDYGSDGTADTPQQNIKRKDTNTATAEVTQKHPFDAELINKGTEDSPSYYVRIYNSALPDSPYAGILYVGDSAFDISVAEIAINTQNGFFIDLSVSYTGSESNPFTTSFNLRQYGTPIPSSDTTYIVSVAEGKIPDVSSRMTSDITVTGRWV